MKLDSKKYFFPFILDHKPGFFLGWFLYRLFKRVRFDENMTEALKKMHRKGTVVYAIKYRGHLDYLLYHYRFRMSRLPYPKIAFDLNMSAVLPLSHLVRVVKFYLACFFKRGRLPSPFKTGFFEEAIQEGTSALLCLVDPKGFLKHFIHAEKDHLYFLLETQRNMDRPIYVVPQLILYKKTPEKEHSSLLDIFFGFRDKAGFIRKTALFFRHNRRAFIAFGKPVNLKDYLDDQPESRPLEEITPELRQILIEGIDVQKRIILGPIMKSRQQLKERVLKDQKVSKTIQDMGAGDAKRVKQLRKKAGGYFDEIAADYSITYIELFNVGLAWLWKKIFQGIEVDKKGLAQVREWARRGPLIYIPSHKSHIDYLVLNYVLYTHHMHIPRIAAGKNLTFWPVGHFFRKVGAFFIRRTFKGARLYTEVFERYVKALLEEGHPLEFFIEGGRSRSGKLILPKMGFISILLKAQKEGYCSDLIFVPASISYDRILEEKSYLKELGGGTKEHETFRQLLKTRHFLKRKYGKIYIRFDQPISLKQYLARDTHGGEEIHRRLALHVMQAINRISLVTPLAIVATAILSRHRRGFYLREVTESTATLLKFLERHQIPIATSLENIEKAVVETLALLTSLKVVKFMEDVEGEETFYYVDEEKKPELEYYKNSIIHCFICHSFVAVSLLTGREEVKSGTDILNDYSFLKEIFKNEFIYEDGKGVQDEIDMITDYFLEVAFITKSDANGGYRLTRSGFDELPPWAALAKTFVESYWIATRSFIQKKNRGAKSGDLLKNMSYLGLRFHKQGLIDHLESVSQVTFRNAIRYINKNILSDQTGSDGDRIQDRERLSGLSQRLYELSRYGT